MNDEELLATLQAADPARRRTGTDSWIDDLLQATMSTGTNPDPKVSSTRRVRLAIGAAAAVAVAVVGVGGYLLARPGSGSPSTTAPSVLTLKVAPANMSASCAAFTPAAMKYFDTVFDGTAVSLADGVATLRVNHWLTPGTADEVALAGLGGTDTQVEDPPIEIKVGTRYLITADKGVLGSCGFSGPWSQQVADEFAAALAN
ncbi:MAG: putative rane protein [Marmoricola sp.]|jgi:hypothetical protein|nr:putative rane protein [Marmoricola sp.]